jgi:predicted DNA-binding protein (MmcQ/YjbR family)
MKPNKQTLLRRFREICLALPDTQETLTWGKPHFRVKDKIFAGFDTESDTPSIGFKLEMKHAAKVIEDPHFRRAPYVGHKGWVDMDLSTSTDWEEVRAMVIESYRLIAPKKSVAALDGAPVVPRRKTTTNARAKTKA